MRVPILASLFVVIGAPYIGLIRAAAQTALPDHIYRLVIAATITGAAAAAIVVACRVVRRSRDATPSRSNTLAAPARYGLVFAAAAIGATYAAALFRRDPDVALVESFHFVEYGLLAILFYRPWRHRPDVSGVLYAACAGVTVGVADEWVQWFVPGRVGEVHDVWLNAAAVGCGLLIGAAIHPPVLTMPRQRGSRLALGAAAAGLLLIVAGFVDRVHIGYEISDAGAVMFRSLYDAQGLSAAAADRPARWSLSPPPDRGFTREDHYLSEGEWHVRRRNAAITSRDWNVAWGENRIIERFYSPVLARGYRLADEERSFIERNQGASRSGYVSDAEPYAIYVIRRSRFWGAMAVAVLTLMGLAAWPTTIQASLA